MASVPIHHAAAPRYVLRPSASTSAKRPHTVAHSRVVETLYDRQSHIRKGETRWNLAFCIPIGMLQNTNQTQKSLCEEWLATVKAEAMDSISIFCGSLPQYIFEGEVGQQGCRLTEHADKLLGRRLHIGVAQQVHTTVHLVALRIDRDSLHTWLGERGGFR